MAVKYFGEGEDFVFGPVSSAKSSAAADNDDNLERFGRTAERRTAMPGLGNLTRRRVPGIHGEPGAATSIAAKPRPPVKRSGVPAFAKGGPFRPKGKKK